MKKIPGYILVGAFLIGMGVWQAFAWTVILRPGNWLRLRLLDCP